MNTFILACGGTGGHLSPGISLAEELTARGHRCVLIISKKKVDSRLIQKYPHLIFERFPGKGFSKNPLSFLLFLIQQIQCLAIALRLLKKEKPCAVITFGGFIAAGIGLASWLYRCPLALHEANRSPGKATRLLSRLVNRIYLPEGVTLRGISLKQIRYLGYPLRREIHMTSKIAARRKLEIYTQGKLIVVLGGSQGAEMLNKWVTQHFDTLARDGISIYCLTGQNKGEPGVFEHRSPSGQTACIYYVPFTDQMSVVLSASDLVISRAGAGSIAEMIRCQTPSILIPYPHAADKHQHANAYFLERQGAAIVIEENNLDHLCEEVCELIFNDWLLERITHNLHAINRLDTTNRLVDDLEKLAKVRPKSLLPQSNLKPL